MDVIDWGLFLAPGKKNFKRLFMDYNKVTNDEELYKVLTYARKYTEYGKLPPPTILTTIEVEWVEKNNTYIIWRNEHGVGTKGFSLKVKEGMRF